VRDEPQDLHRRRHVQRRRDTDPFLQHEQGIIEEVESWLESLRATVHKVTVRDVEKEETQ
jgi:hypothetical protein